MNETSLGEKFKVDDLHDLSDKSIFKYYKMQCFPFEIFMDINEFIHMKMYNECKSDLIKVIRKQKIDKLCLK